MNGRAGGEAAAWLHAASVLLLPLAIHCAQPPSSADLAETVGPRPRFVDAAAEAGLGTLSASYAAATADFDRDGWPDLAVSEHQRLRFYRNLRGRFEDRSAEIGAVPEDIHGVSWIDLDRDGWLDLLASVGANRGFGNGANHIYRNRQGATLALDPSASEVLHDPQGRGRCLVAADLDRDGLLDVAVVNVAEEGRWNRFARGAPDRDYEAAGAASDLARLEAECFTVLPVAGSENPLLVAYGGGRHGGQAFRPEPGGVLRDVTAELGLTAGRGTIYSAVAGDYDNDGDLDLYLVRGHEIPPTVTRVDHGLGFRMVATNPLQPPSLTFRCPCDFVVDLTVGFERDARRVRLGADGGSPPSIPWTVARGTSAVEGAPRSQDGLGFYLWRSAPYEYTLNLTGDGRKVRGASGTLRADGCELELVEATEDLSPPSRPTPNQLFRNRGGTFEEITEQAGVGDHHSGRDAVFFDADNDGDLDLFVVNGGTAFDNQPDVLYLNRGDGTFADASAEAGIVGPDSFSRGATVTALDYDRDGDVDLFVTNGDGPPIGNRGPHSLWRNDTPSQGHWVEVELIGDEGNPTAMGAAVLASFGDRRLLAARTSSSSRFSTSVLPLHFGLGDADDATLEVYWPSGRVSRATARAGERVVIRDRKTESPTSAPPSGESGTGGGASGPPA